MGYHMQVVILCGGKGSRLGEVTENRIPKPMVTIGEQPILWHIMHSYARAGHNRFILCAGHLSWAIKEYFLNFHARNADLRLRTSCPDVEYLNEPTGMDWDVTIVETGAETQTAGRLARVMQYIEGHNFMLTYGDGVSDVDIGALTAFHEAHGRAITITGVVPPGRFGELALDGDVVTAMVEKPMVSDRYINGGFMVLRRGFVARFIPPQSDEVMLETAPMADAAAAGEMRVFRHQGFWQPMDTQRDWALLNDLWRQGKATW
jgi:glucose-1-phosphate cytidylyltransferase